MGVKGGDSASKALGGVKSGLGEVKSMSLEAKAGIAAVIYGLERMMSASAQTGTNLLNFTSVTGISGQALQQWQFAAKSAGVSADEMTGSMKSVSSTMMNMRLGHGAPSGLTMLAEKVGFDSKKALDTQYVLGQIQKLSQVVPPQLGLIAAKSFGVSENVFAAMTRNAFRPDVMNKAPTYSNNEIGKLNQVGVAWDLLGNKIEMAMGHLTAKEGLSIVNDISKMTTEVLRLVTALTKLAESVQVFKAIGFIFKGWSELLGVVNDQVGSVTKDKKGIGHGLAENLKSNAGGAGLAIQGAFMTLMDQLGAPSVDPSKNSGAQQNINVNQTLNFQHDGKDAKKTGDSVHKAVKDAYRQRAAQAEGT